MESIETSSISLLQKAPLCIDIDKKFLVTTDSDPIEKVRALEKYGVKILTLRQAEEILLKS